MNPSSRIGKPIALFVAAIVFALATPAPGVPRNGPVTVNAGFIDPSVDAGQSAEYHIEITNGDTAKPPPEPQVDSLTFTFTNRNESQQLTINNFQPQYTTTTIYVYTVETTRSGRFVIPGQQIDVDGTSLRTPPSTLTVLDPGGGGADAPGRMLSIELIVPRKSAYVGESVPVELRVYLGLQVALKQIESEPQIEGEGFSIGKWTQPRMVAQVIDNAQVQVVTYKSTLTGAKVGALTVGPVTLVPTVQIPNRRTRRRGGNGMFDDPFFDGAFNNMFDMAPARKVKLRTEAANVEIKTLPPGKPADFSGGIGEFKLEAEADPRKAQAGDPVTVRLVLSGKGNFDRITAPVLTDEKGLRIYPATSKFKADDDVGLSGLKTFEQVVIADAPRASLPPYRFSYLDPSTGKYATIDTPPIPVAIAGGNTPAPSASAAPVGPSASAPTATPEPSRPPKPAEDILYIRTDPGPARTLEDFLPVYRRRTFWITQGAMLAGLLAVAAVGGLLARVRNEKARRQAQFLRQQAELQRALQREDTGRGEFYSAATQLARLKAAMAAGQPTGSLSVADICRAKGLDAVTTGSVEKIFHRHDELAYSGGRAAQEPVSAVERRGVLATLETLEKKG